MKYIIEGYLPAQSYVDFIRPWFISNIDSKAKRTTNQSVQGLVYFAA